MIYPLVDDTDEGPDKRRAQEENEQPYAVRNICGTFKRRQTIREHFD